MGRYLSGSPSGDTSGIGELESFGRFGDQTNRDPVTSSLFSLNGHGDTGSRTDDDWLPSRTGVLESGQS